MVFGGFWAKPRGFEYQGLRAARGRWIMLLKVLKEFTLYFQAVSKYNKSLFVVKHYCYLDI